MLRRLLGVIVGLCVGFLAVLLVEGLSLLVYPFPSGLDMSDAQAMQRYVENLPAGALVIVVVAHIAGSFAGAFACAAVVRHKWITGSLLIGILLLVGGLVNLFRIPHPLWFAIADVIVYIPFSLLGGRAGWRLFGSRGISS